MEIRLTTSLLMIMSALYIGTNPKPLALIISLIVLILMLIININCNFD